MREILPIELDEQRMRAQTEVPVNFDEAIKLFLKVKRKTQKQIIDERRRRKNEGKI